MDPARLADPAWTAGVGGLGREQGRKSFGEERRAALPGHCRSKPTGLWAPGWGAVSSQGSQGLKGEGKGGRQWGSWCHPDALGCPGTADRAASTPRGHESSSHNDGLKRAITRWTTCNTGNKSTASMQHHRVVR